MNTYYDYILASGKNGTLYNGVTNNLIKRVAQHKRKEVKGFAEKYEVNKLVWYEQTNDISIAIKREKQIKKWNRKWKIRLIEKENPEWNDLFFEIGGTEDMLDPNFLI
ncbi:MAG: GIY-YIG nuclease family protein [Ignavibacteria bacterium]|nr:GIY-YIG nuclease family protein [Ignavibacteria bacterium]